MSSELAVTTKDLGTRLWLLWYRDLINLLDSYVLTYWTQLCMHCYTCTCIATALCSYTAPLQGEAGLPGNLSCLIAGAAHIIIGTSHMYPVISHSGTRKCTVWSLGYTAGVKPRNRQCMEENAKKATSIFLYKGIGVFQDNLSLLSSQSVMRWCMMPILLYGSRNCVVSEELLRRLESFQWEMGKRILGMQKIASNTAVGTFFLYENVNVFAYIYGLVRLQTEITSPGQRKYKVS